MTTTGLTIESPKIGQTITFLTTGCDTGGAELVIEARMRPGAFMPPHRHLHQDETFEVLAGTATFSVAGRRITAGPGERVHAPAGVAHRFRNRSDQDVRLRAAMRPALRTEDLFERLFRLERRVGSTGSAPPIPSPPPG